MNNYFKLLGIEQNYAIDLDLLDQQYFAMQLKYHPDKRGDISEKNFNLAISIDLNKAYSVLRDDLARAEHLLMLNNVSLDELAARQSIPQSQLKIIWDELELVENTVELAKLQNLLDNKIYEQKDLIVLLTTAFQNHNIQDALETAVMLKYLKTLINNIQLKIKECK